MLRRRIAIAALRPRAAPFTHALCSAVPQSDSTSSKGNRNSEGTTCGSYAGSVIGTSRIVSNRSSHIPNTPPLSREAAFQSPSRDFSKGGSEFGVFLRSDWASVLKANARTTSESIPGAWQRQFVASLTQTVNSASEGTNAQQGSPESSAQQEASSKASSGDGAAEAAGAAAGEEASKKESETQDPKDKEIAELKERVLRAYADMENLMVRMKRENESTRQFAIQGFAKALLDVADNLSRANEVASAAFPRPGKQGTEGEQQEPVGEGGEGNSSALGEGGLMQHMRSFLEGVEATERQLLRVFKAHGLEKVQPLGETFDPNVHEAMFEVESQDKEPGVVVHVLKHGYLLNGRVLRAAEVGVTKKPNT